ncbi:D-alanyl-D-alanine carboxypeptidase [Streptomyces sp. NPDC028635]|uniref:D-alanyl-D-alanine carboxypeptidase n=1 Tax=Streptomyces sp. NPDC028635 TaxID=3154800 RepID=UPI00340B7666
MAGESPDKSKQRESSAEPTPGSTAPVPEARIERSGDSATGASDPRLAVARGSGTPHGGVDTATRVLSVRDLAEDAGETGAESASAGGAEGGSEGGADGEETSAADSGAEDGAEKGAEGRTDGGTPEDDTSDDDTSDDAPEDASSDGDTSDADGDGDAPGTGGDERLREAVAAWVRSADSDGGPAKTKGSDEPEKAPEAAQAPEEGPSTADQVPEKADEAPEAAGKAPEPADAAPETAAADDKAEADEQAEAGTADTADASEDAAEGAADADEAPEDAPAGKGGDQPTTMLKIGDAPKARVGKGNVDQPTTMLKLGDVRPKPAGQAKDAKDAKEGSRDSEAGASAKSAKDAKDSTKDTKGSKAPEDARPAESEAERTSKFVALKPLDDPSTRKPARPAQPPANEATTALRRVTPGTRPTDAEPADAKPAAAKAADAKAAPASRNAAPKTAAKATPPAPPAEATAAIPQVGPERTTQQPLPPKPPLDLLAELTNTPPPPQTPLRTAVRRVKIWTPLVLLLVIVFAVVQAVRPLPTPTLDLTAEDSYTFDGGKVDIPWPSSGQAALDVQGIGTFGSSGDRKPVPIASVAKVMTAYLILRDHPLKSGEDGPKIGIDQTAQAQSDAGQESTVHVTAGDSITEREALESILIASANNVARLLARWDSGSEQAFVAKMNTTAKSLGMTDTTYTDPSGLNNTTVSTAVDQVKLAKQAMEEPAFREVAAMMEYVDYKGVKHPNWNGLVGHNHVVGIKTGTTTSALGNLVFAAKKDVDGVTHRIVGAVVRQPAGGPENTILSAALDGGDKLIRAAQAALQSKTIVKKGDVVGYVDDGVGGRTPVVVTQDVTAVGWAGLKVKLSFAADALPHTAKAGTKVGTLTVGDGSGDAVKVPVALQKDLTEPGFADKLTRLG